MDLLTFETDDKQLLVHEYSKGFVVIESGRLHHAGESKKFILTCLEGDEATYYLTVSGVSLDLSYWEFKALIDFGFTVELC